MTEKKSQLGQKEHPDKEQLRQSVQRDNHRLLQGLSISPPEVQMVQCLDATEYFSWRSSKGINLYKTYYNCSCTGDLKSRFTLKCALENYCRDTDTNDADIKNNTTVTQCISRTRTYVFLVNSMGVIDKLEKGRDCTEYLTGVARNLGRFVITYQMSATFSW